jgi:hypothetical protein
MLKRAPRPLCPTVGGRPASPRAAGVLCAEGGGTAPVRGTVRPLPTQIAAGAPVLFEALPSTAFFYSSPARVQTARPTRVSGTCARPKERRALLACEAGRPTDERPGPSPIRMSRWAGLSLS